MKPDLSNYEIWFIDWIDGKLDDQQVSELRSFLDEHPDLSEELQSLAGVTLKPDDCVFCGKEMLKKSAENFSTEQFEYLCIAHLENDLSDAQLNEIQGVIENDASRKRTFELISKLKLTPPDLTFTRKRHLRKLTAGGKIFRLAAAGLSAAATIAVIVILRLSIPLDKGSNPGLTAGDLGHDTLVISTGSPVISRNMPEVINSGENHPAISGTDEILKIPSSDLSETNYLAAETVAVAEDTDPAVYNRNTLIPNKLSVPIHPELITGNGSKSGLAAFKSLALPSFFDDGRSNVERFVARFFHEKIMRDPESGDRPVKSVDIAEAGITGLNKLFGWEMALQKNTDQNGETKSYYFSSRLVKFNAPVKKAAKEL